MDIPLIFPLRAGPSARVDLLGVPEPDVGIEVGLRGSGAVAVRPAEPPLVCRHHKSHAVPLGEGLPHRAVMRSKDTCRR